MYQPICLVNDVLAKYRSASCSVETIHDCCVLLSREKERMNALSMGLFADYKARRQTAVTLFHKNNFFADQFINNFFRVVANGYQFHISIVEYFKFILNSCTNC